MAKILSYFHLCPINDEEEFLGLSRDQTKGNVINTLGKNIIINVKVWPPLALFFSMFESLNFVWFSVEQSETNQQLDCIGQAVEQSHLRCQFKEICWSIWPEIHPQLVS